MKQDKKCSQQQTKELYTCLQNRFEKNMHRHNTLKWQAVQEKLEKNPAKVWTLHQMEATGGEPDVIGYDDKNYTFIFCDCAPESPKGRRSVCYDPEALASRKQYKPKHSAAGMAAEMGVELLTETQYRNLQKLGEFDTKTSSWINTSPEIRELGGALFGDRRFGHVFTYHNGAESYYASRGFRGILEL